MKDGLKKRRASLSFKKNYIPKAYYRHFRCRPEKFSVSHIKMPKSETQGNERKEQLPPGYPNENHPPPKKKCCPPRSTKKGERGFIEGCIAALCCCWLCEECF
ncbi:cysteine-rich and transmembrane domain-containing protein A [Cinnamomum micranthum f. kanehirae]|uniref:Cysteine-rich and transmembrane domain-containing protein A n=1 Tax=Cinnamomum micranthum f. kanehirae TaxID=337451 RepID=A0A443N825_9MAGN|nr:cysteine-rich and transmembrane domain-containing protein A [Cinnamomum micranthum f. kanehirae]